MKLEITDKQARILINALDHYSRLGMGQLWTIAEVLEGLRPEIGSYRKICQQWTDPMQSALFPAELDGKVPDVCNIAYDLQCVIRADIARREAHPISSVWRGPPLHTCKAEPLAKVTE